MGTTTLVHRGVLWVWGRNYWPCGGGSGDTYVVDILHTVGLMLCVLAWGEWETAIILAAHLSGM